MYENSNELRAMEPGPVARMTHPSSQVTSHEPEGINDPHHLQGAEITTICLSELQESQTSLVEECEYDTVISAGFQNLTCPIQVDRLAAYITSHKDGDGFTAEYRVSDNSNSN